MRCQDDAAFDRPGFLPPDAAHVADHTDVLDRGAGVAPIPRLERPYGASVTSSLRTLEQRLRAVEARLAEVEGGYGDTHSELRRSTVRTDLRLERVLAHLDIADVTDDEVDEVDEALDRD